MKELIFADGRKVNIQSVTEAEGVMHIRMILITAEEIKALFGDEFATSRMVLTKNYQEKEVYENYTDLKYIKEETGGIWEVEIQQTQADNNTRIERLEEKTKKQEETLKSQQESIKEQEKEIGKIKENMGVTPELQAAIAVAKYNAQSFPDQVALEAKVLYETFDQLVEQKFTAKEKGYKFRDGDDLYKTAQDNVTFQAQYRPGSGTESLYTHIDEAHSGTLEDPIPAKANMEYEYGKYYIEKGTIYLCKRGGVEDPESMYGEKITLQYLPSQLIGQYFEIVK